MCGIKASHVVVWLEKPCRGNNGQEVLHLEFVAQSDSYRVLLTIDHIIPRSQGGTDAYGNLQILCEPCNQAKADMPNDVFVRIFFEEHKSSSDYDKARAAVEEFRDQSNRIRQIIRKAEAYHERQSNSEPTDQVALFMKERPDASDH
jgi:hypothetical protein